MKPHPAALKFKQCLQNIAKTHKIPKQARSMWTHLATP